MTPSRRSVFVSYTVRDGTVSETALRRFLACLDDPGQYYVDLLHNRGREPQCYVIRQLERASAVVLIDTPAIRSSPWVLRELEAARSWSVPVWVLPGWRFIVLSS